MSSWARVSKTILELDVFRGAQKKGACGARSRDRPQIEVDGLRDGVGRGFRGGSRSRGRRSRSRSRLAGPSPEGLEIEGGELLVAGAVVLLERQPHHRGHLPP